MIETVSIREGFTEEILNQFFDAINTTTMRRSNFDEFKKAYQNRSVVLSVWQDDNLIAFGSMLTDWNINSIIYDVVVLNHFQKRGYGKRIMQELMKKASGTRFYLTSTFGNEEFYRKLGFRKHKTAFAMYPTESPYLE